MAQKKKVLIIKLGYSETLRPETGNTCSLGDVLRATVILHIFKNENVTWLTDKKAFPLLDNNPYINRILTFDILTTLQLLNEKFDILVNLEKVPGICSLADKIDAWHKYGFRLNPDTGVSEAYELSQEALSINTKNGELKRKNKCWQEILFEILNKKWNKEGYILGYKPKTKVKYDIGFNKYVGSKLPVKVWPLENWKKLENKLGKKYRITHQKSLNNLEGYIDWINSCRLIITNDSLGLHIAIALNKKIIVLIGPTSVTEFPKLDNIKFITPSIERECIPCFNPYCEINDPCMKYISVEEVVKNIKNEL